MNNIHEQDQIMENNESDIFTFQFSHPTFWGFQVKMTFNELEQLMKDSISLQDIIIYCVIKMKLFFHKYNLMELKELVEREINDFHIHEPFNTIESVFVNVKCRSLSINDNSNKEIFNNMSNVCYICNKKYCSL